MDQQAREQAFISALTTEQFVLQAARSANIGEMTGRGTVYMGAVSSSLIALGLLAQVVTRLDPFVAAVLPAVFVLGEFTFAALLRNTLENLVLLRQMQRIRGYYRTLAPEAELFFGPAAEDERYSAAMATVGLRARRLGMLFTGASVVAAINSMVGGVGLALLAAKVASLATGAVLAVGSTAAVALFGLHLLYQQQRATDRVLQPSAEAGLS
jgi:MFS family permease